MQNPAFSKRCVLALAAIALSGSAFAAGQDGQSSQIVTKDPITGKLRNATAAEAKQLNDLRAQQRAVAGAARKAAGGPQTNVVRLQKNGSLAMHVDEESMSYSVMHRTADGKLELNCIHGKEAADHAATTANTDSKEHQNEVQ